MAISKTTYSFFVPQDIKNIFDEAIQVGLNEREDREKIFYELDEIKQRMAKWLIDFEKDKKEFERIRERNNILIKKTEQYAQAFAEGGEKSNTGKTYRQFVASMYNNKSYQDLEIVYANKQKATLKTLNDAYNKAAKKLTKTFLIGYTLWEAFRTLVVGQDIKFSILYKNDMKLYEAENITILELIKRGKFKLEYDEKKGGLSYKIGLIGIEKLKKEEMPDLNKLNDQQSRRFTNAVFYNQLLNRFGPLYHRWVVYEVYLRFKTFEDFPLYRGVTDAWFNPDKYEKTFQWLKGEFDEADADWASGRKIGDYLNIQAKDLSSGNAHLSAIQSLPTDIKKLVESYDINKPNLIPALKDLLTEDMNKGTVHIDKATKEMNEDAQKKIDELFEPLLTIKNVSEG